MPENKQTVMEAGSQLKSCFLLFLLFFCQLCAAQVTTDAVDLTEQEQQWVKNNPTIFVGGSPDWTPFNFVDEHGQYAGIANEYLQLIANKTGLNFSVSIDSWHNSLQKIQAKQLDVLGAVYYTDERTQFLTYSKPYFEVLDYFFIRNDLDVNSFEDLRGLRLAIPKGYAHIALLEKHFPAIEIITVNTFGEAIDTVLEGKAELLYDSYGSLIYSLEKQGINTIVPFKSTRYIGTNPIHIVTRKDKPELAAIIQKGLTAITAAERRLIFEKWLGQSSQANKLNLTEQEQQWLDAHPVIDIRSEADWAPYEFMGQNGQMQGLSIDILRLIETKLGIRFDSSSDGSWVEALAKAKKYDLDMLSGTVQTPERGVFLNFSQAYFSPPSVIYTRNDRPAIKSLDSLAGKTVAIEDSYYLHEKLKNDFPKIKLIRVTSTLDALKAVSFGDAYAYVGNQGVANWLIGENALTNLKINSDSGLGVAGLRFAIRKDWPLLPAILDKALATITESEMLVVRQKWLGTEFVEKPFILSSSEQLWLAEHPEIRFTGDPNWLPYEGFDQQGSYIGIVAEHLKLIEQKLGVKMTIIPSVTWSESVAKVRRNEIDVLSETTNSNLTSQLSFTQPYISSPVVIVMNHDENYVESLTQIKQKKIAVIKEYGYVPEIVENYPNLNFEIVDSIQDGLTAVSTGKVDALLATLAQASYHISEMGINNIRIVGKTEFTTELAFGMQADFEALVPLFNRALNSISRSQKQQIQDAWGKGKFTKQVEVDYGLAIKIAILLLIIISGIVFWNRKLAQEVRLRQQAEAQVQTLLDQIPLQIVVSSREGKILEANPQTLRDYNIDKSQLATFGIMDFYLHAHDREEVLAELASKGQVQQKIVPFKHLDGEVRSMMISIMPIVYHNQPSLLAIGVDMTERLEMESALNEAKEFAERASHAKSEFLANMSHEIRTPMNAIIGFTELLQEQIKEPKLKAFANTIQSAGNALLQLINDILDLSKIEAGKIEIKKRATNPHKLFDELANIFMMNMKKKGLDFIVEIDSTIPVSLMLDTPRLRQVLLNLIGNAVKFTEHGHVRLIARAENEDEVLSKLDLAIEVTDSGIGIPENQLATIFGEFEQTENQDAAKFGGTGLGLSISQRLTQLMGGEIQVESKVGIGSNFTVRLKGVDVASIQDESVVITAAPDVDRLDFSPAVILVVDDIEDNRQLVKANFESTELRVLEAENGLQAVDLVKESHIDLILMDIRMPVMDGYQAAQQIKSFSSLPIVALTASVMKDEYERVITKDFDGYLRKPVLRSELFIMLSQFLHCNVTKQSQGQPEAMTLLPAERRVLPDVIACLSQKSNEWKMLLEENNISAIKLFAHSLINIADEHRFSPLAEYGEQLLIKIDAFDIEGIRFMLEAFFTLQQSLQAELEA